MLKFLETQIFFCVTFINLITKSLGKSGFIPRKSWWYEPSKFICIKKRQIPSDTVSVINSGQFL